MRCTRMKRLVALVGVASCTVACSEGKVAQPPTDAAYMDGFATDAAGGGECHLIPGCEALAGPDASVGYCIDGDPVPCGCLDAMTGTPPGCMNSTALPAPPYAAIYCCVSP